jgi:hypothetical protein
MARANKWTATAGFARMKEGWLRKFLGYRRTRHDPAGKVDDKQAGVIPSIQFLIGPTDEMDRTGTYKMN